MEREKLLLLPVFLLMFSLTFISASLPTPIIYYKMDETSGDTVINYGSWDVDGTSEGINTTDGSFMYDGLPSVQFVEGVKGGAYDFGTYTNFTLGNPEYYNISRVDTKYDTCDTYSGFLWVKPKNMGGGVPDDTDMLIGEGMEYSGWGEGIYYDGETKQFFFEAGVGGWLSPDLNLVNGEWYRFGYVMNDTNLRLFVNGQKVFDDTFDGIICDGNLTVGWRRHTQPNAPYFGISNVTIDEVKVWDVPLTDAQALEDYNSYYPYVPTSGGILHYDNLIGQNGEKEPTPTTPVTGEVTNQPKASFGLFSAINNLFVKIGAWFSNLFK